MKEMFKIKVRVYGKQKWIAWKPSALTYIGFMHSS